MKSGKTRLDNVYDLTNGLIDFVNDNDLDKSEKKRLVKDIDSLCEMWGYCNENERKGNY